MFEDTANSPQPAAPSGFSPTPPPRPEPPLPVGTPVPPMGSGQSVSPRPTPPPPPPPAQSFGREPEDILAAVEKEERATRGPDLPAPSLKVVAAKPPVEKPEAQEPVLKRGRKVIMLLAGGLIALAVLGAAGWYAYSLYLESQSLQPPADNQVPVQPASGLGQQPAPTPPDTAQPGAVPTPPPPPVDSDSDGLSDQEEALYGSDPAIVDTDDDGLTDRDEAVVFKTDPNNPDTDGDTYLDGDEVRNGYDPKGSGKILDLP